MNTQLLIDAVVRQTTILIAHLATAGGLRAPVSHIAEEVFNHLAEELDRQGISRRVSADMFGMTLRTYQRRVSRLSESRTFRGKSLWEAVFGFIRSRGVVSRLEVMQRFSRDDQDIIRGVLHDLAESGMVFARGKGSAKRYRSASEQELEQMRQSEERDSVDNLLWILVYREGPISVQKICELSRLSEGKVAESIQRLTELGRIHRQSTDNGPAYVSGGVTLPADEPTGWQAAVFDHFQAAVASICQKLRLQDRDPAPAKTGGSTYTFVIWPGHPLEQEVERQLEEYRKRMTALRRRVNEHNERCAGAEPTKKVISYSGQYTIGPDNGRDGNTDDDT